MSSRKVNLLAASGVFAGLLALFLGLLQMALPALLGGLALLLGLAAWGLVGLLPRPAPWRVKAPPLTPPILRLPLRLCSGHGSGQALGGNLAPPEIGGLGGPFSRQPLLPPRPTRGRSARRSSYRRAYRLASLLVIVALLAGMIPAPALYWTQGTAYAAPAERPAAQPQAQAAAGTTPSGKGQPVIEGPPGVTVNLYNGNLNYRRVDLTTSPGGYPFPVLQSELTYNSLTLGIRGRRGFGPGWRFGYDMSYSIDENIFVYGPRGLMPLPLPGVPEPALPGVPEPQVLDPWRCEQEYFDKMVSTAASGGGDGYAVADVLPWWCTRQEFEFHGYFTVYWPDGREVQFRRLVEVICQPSGGRLTCVKSYTGYFEAPPGVYDRLEVLGNDAYRLTTPEGTVYYFDSPRHQKVTRIEAENGLALVITDGKVEDAYGRALHLTYGSGGVTRITNDFLSRPLTLTYDADGNLATITDPAGQVTSYHYQGAVGRLDQIILPDGQEVTFDYEARYSKVCDPTLPVLGGRTDGCYEKLIGFRVTSIRGSYGSWDFQYHDVVRGEDRVREGTTVVRIVNGQPQRTRYTVDDKGRATQIEDPLGNVTRFDWDPQDNLIAVTDPAGGTTSYTYDSMGNVRSIADALGHTTVFAYAAGTSRLLSRADALGRVWRYEYDSQGRLVKAIAPDGAEFAFAYDPFSHLTVMTDTLGNVFRNSYDAWGHLVAQTRPDGQQTRLLYNGQDLPVHIALANEITFTLGYNAYGDLTSFGPLDEPPYRYTYDAARLPASLSMPGGATWHYEHNDQGLLAWVRDPLDNVTRYEWQGEDLSAIIDANQHTRNLSWDAAGRLVGAQDPLGQRTTYTRDRRGEITRITYPDDITLTYQLDALARIVEEHTSDGQRTRYQYDAAGNLLQVENDQVRVNFGYDQLKRTTEVTVLYLPSGQQYTTRYEYDLRGRRTAMTDPQGGRTTYTYDANGQLTSITDPEGNTTTLAYNPLGQGIRRTDANGVTLEIARGSWGRPTDLRYTKDGAVLFHESITYDVDGNSTRIAEENGPTLNASYDPLGRLIAAQASDGLSWHHTYDPAGNRLSQVGTGGTITYTYDVADQLLQAGTGTAATNYTYDPRGNLTARTTATSTQAYAWEAHNWLNSATVAAGQQVTYTYYPDGLPLSRTGPDGQTVLYLYDGLNLSMEIDAQSGAVLARYLSEPDEFDYWISMRRDGQTYTYLADHLGSIRTLADASGAVVATYRYAPYGELLATSGAVVNPLRYTGRRWDADLGLYEYRSRYYDPQTERFISRDKDPGLLHYPLTQNPYLYASDNPLRYIDPTGSFLVLFQIRDAMRRANESAERQKQIYDTLSDEHTHVDAYELSKQWSQEFRQALGNIAADIAQSVPGTTVFPYHKLTHKIIFQLIEKGLISYEELHRAWERGGKEEVEEVLRRQLENPEVQQQLVADSYNNPEPYEPPTTEPPNRLSDHQDDTHSVASPQLPAAGPTGLTTDVSRFTFYGIRNTQYVLRNTTRSTFHA